MKQSFIFICLLFFFSWKGGNNIVHIYLMGHLLTLFERIIVASHYSHLNILFLLIDIHMDLNIHFLSVEIHTDPIKT